MQLLVNVLLSQKKLQLIRKLLKFNLLPKILTKRILLAKVILLWWSLEQHRLKMVKYPLSQFSQQTLSKTPWSQVGIHLPLGRLIFKFSKFLAYLNICGRKLSILGFSFVDLSCCLHFQEFCPFLSWNISRFFWPWEGHKYFWPWEGRKHFGHERVINIFGHGRAINVFNFRATWA